MDKNTPKKPLKIFVISGEPSGDQMAVEWLKDIKEKYPDAIFSGVGDECLKSVGAQSLFPMKDLSVMGITEVLPRLRLILKRIKQTTKRIIAENPDYVIGVDSPDFCLRVMKKLHKARQKDSSLRFKLFHVVAPTVWAWRPGRAKKIAAFLDHLFCLFPFEPPFFEEVGLKASYIGHPFVPLYKKPKPLKAWRKDHEIKENAPLIGILPGSRMGEISRMLPVFMAAAKDIQKYDAKAHFVILTLPHLEDEIKAMTRDFKGHLAITSQKGMKVDFLAGFDVAMATSGTIGLELSLAKTPHLIAYKMNKFSAVIARRLVKTPYVHLTNVHLGRMAVPECIQEQCTASRVARDIVEIMDSEKRRNKQMAAFDELDAMLSHDKTTRLVDLI